LRDKGVRIIAAAYLVAALAAKAATQDSPHRFRHRQRSSRSGPGIEPQSADRQPYRRRNLCSPGWVPKIWRCCTSLCLRQSSSAY
jgi:hypothetical protein